MHKISVPVVLHERFDKDATLAELRRAGADRVFLAVGIPSCKKEKREKFLTWLREYVPFFKSAGLEVGIWFWTFWRTDIQNGETLMADSDGEKKGKDNGDGNGLTGFCCPESSEFTDEAMEIIREYAECRPDILMFDDDYRYGYIGKSLGCFCDAHMRAVSAKLGYEISREELYKKIYGGEPCRERRVWQDCLGESFENFARRVRETVDSVNPAIRFAMCSCMSVWDYDGTDSIKIAKILAGNTRPLLRLIGAPYWAPGYGFNCRLQNVIELERMEHHWCEGEDIEIMTEGDVYPRPRQKIPSAYLEGFDTALRAADVGEYIHKYMIDYTSSPTYETGYVNAHLRHAPAYEAIDRIFGGKTVCGVGVYEKMKKLPDADLTGIEKAEEYVKDTFYSKGAKMLADNTVPIVYGDNCEVCTVFGENARDLPESVLKKPMILDIRAAKLLAERGIDVGLERVGDSIMPDLLYFPEYNEYISSDYKDHAAYEITPSENAKIISFSIKGDKKYPDAYTYENAQGQKFLVFAFDAAFAGKHRFRSYCMQKLLYSAIEWLAGNPLPAKCAGNPDLYILTKRGGDGSLAVGLWNFFVDEIAEPVVELDREYAEIEFFGCTGKKVGNKLYLSTLKPFDFIFINAK